MRNTTHLPMSQHGPALSEARRLCAGLDFETQILVKHDAPALRRHALASPRWHPRVLAMSGVTDPYQPVERRLRLTRRCLEVLAEFRNPVVVVTKSALVTRDVDVLTALARDNAAAVFLSVTTLGSRFARRLEPRASQPTRRLAAIDTLAQAGVPLGVLVAPVIPGLTEHELSAILTAAAWVGAQYTGSVTLRLPRGVVALFEDWLHQHAPTKKTKIPQCIRALRGGKLNDARFGVRMQGEGVFADHIAGLFTLGCRKAWLQPRDLRLSTAAFRRRRHTPRLARRPHRPRRGTPMDSAAWQAPAQPWPLSPYSWRKGWPREHTCWPPLHAFHPPCCTWIGGSRRAI